MRSRTNALATLVIVVSASLLTACSGSDDPESKEPAQEPTPAAPTYDQSSAFTARILPRLATPSDEELEAAGTDRTEPAAADDAAWVVEARTKKAKAGTTVELHALVDGEWAVVDDATTDKSGVASLTTTVDGDLHVTADVAGPELGAAVSTEDVPAVSFDDEFDEDSVNTEGGKWFTRHQGYAGVRQCSKADDGAAEVSDGVLRLSVLDDPDAGECTIPGGEDQGERHAYRLNGHVGTENTYSFTYGYAAARVKFQPGRGQHGSFWLQAHGGPAGKDIRVAGSEIDVAEYFGDDHPQGGLTSFTYWFDPQGGKHTQGGWVKDADQYGEDWGEQYHVFSVEWTPQEYVFRIDGQVTHRLPGHTSAQPEFLVLSLLSSDYELRHSEELPQAMDVDWVRVWETPQG